MGEQTAIAWTDHTFSPWWGCQRVSPGCEHCYAETFAKRLGLDVWGPTWPKGCEDDEHTVRVKTAHRKGEDPTEWPTYIQRQGFPEVRR